MRSVPFPFFLSPFLLLLVLIYLEVWKKVVNDRISAPSGDAVYNGIFKRQVPPRRTRPVPDPNHRSLTSMAKRVLPKMHSETMWK